MRVVGVDTGGTFTDFIFFDGRQVRTHKVLSTPGDPSRAVLEGLRELGVADRVVHGSTVATNVFLERKGARVAFYTTEGFEDLIEIGRQTRGALYDLGWSRPEPLVPRALRIGVRERIGPDGRVLLALGRVRRMKADAYAVGFLHSYANPKHERAVGRALGRASLSSEILPEYREYERFSTTVLNAYVAPAMERYVGCLARGLGNRLRLMRSDGGTMDGRTAAERPVHTLLSGPAGGVLAAKALGIDHLITFDMGGTSTDVSVLEGAPRITKEGMLGGYPLRVPMLEIHTVGAGGGSIARVDAGGALRVGPESAGASPGPICYGLGGRRPTVTDANLVLGRIDPELFFGGRMKLRRVAMKRSFAEGILEVADANMERAIRHASVERGYDPARFRLLAFGGAGPLHACALADRLGMLGVIVPRWPGLFSALGLAMADEVRERSRTCLGRRPDFAALEREVRRELGPQCRLERFAEMRYVGQSYEIRVPAGGDFHEAHRRLYGFAREAPMEIVNAVVRGTVRVPKPRRHPLRKGGRLLGHGRFDREALGRGDAVRGPAVISEDNATTWLPRGWRCTVSTYGDLWLER